MDNHGCVTWRERLAEARSSGITNELLQLAVQWTTCAIGEQRRLHPQIVVCRIPACPSDNILWGLGVEFYAALKEMNVPKADMILDRIEDRIFEMKRGEKPNDDVA